MSTISAVIPATTTVARPVTISVRELLPWAVFVGFVMMMLMYVVGLEQGATSLFGGTLLHEWVHDARHLLGFPCH